MTGRQHEIREAARSMIERYGRAALQQVDQRIGELREHGEEETLRLWRDVRTQVSSMLDARNDGKTH